MFEDLIQYFNTTDTWRYAVMPFISAFVGWITNVVALKMMFYPIEFWGIKPFLGWQGIVPKKARKMAANSVDLMTSKLISIQSIFAKLDADEINVVLEPTVARLVGDVVPDVLERETPWVWTALPNRVQKRIVGLVVRNTPQVVEAIFADLQNNINTLFDVRTMVIEMFDRDKPLLNELFLTVGGKELKFIERSGIYFGFLFGLIQMTIWIFIQPSWLLPVAGLFVGCATNWLALKMIFTPIEPRKIGPFTLQGLFLKRQDAVSAEYALMFAERILTAENIIHMIVHESGSAELRQIITQHIHTAIDEATGLARPMIEVAMGRSRYANLKGQAASKVLDLVPHHVAPLYPYADAKLEIQQEIETNMKKLSSAEFEQVLHPIFQEDEWILIAVGAALGLGVGLFQLFILFGGG